MGTSIPPEKPALAQQPGFLWGLGSGPAPGKSHAKEAASHNDIKVVVGNKTLMVEEDITISKSVDEYMRDMEVATTSFSLCGHKAAGNINMEVHQSKLCRQCLSIIIRA